MIDHKASGFPGRGQPWPEDPRACEQMLRWNDEHLQAHAEATARGVAQGLTRAEASWRAYIEVRRSRNRRAA